MIALVCITNPQKEIQIVNGMNSVISELNVFTAHYKPFPLNGTELICTLAFMQIIGALEN